MWTWFHRLASPPSFYRFADVVAPWTGVIGGLLLVVGWAWGLAFAPPDYQQGDAFRIIYAHVPAAALSLGLYVGMAVAGACALIWRMKLAEVVMLAMAPVGLVMTAVTLVTGMLWGKPMWGAWWVWDARLTAELVLLFLYLGVIVMGDAIDDPRRSARAAAWIAVVGVINVPIVKFSVEWWNSLHQGATILSLGRPAISAEMAWPLYLCLLAALLLSAHAVLRRAQGRLLHREARARWVRALAQAERGARP
jgi:heme exporter protein C